VNFIVFYNANESYVVFDENYYILLIYYQPRMHGQNINGNIHAEL